jgi:Na+/proline symporter
MRVVQKIKTCFKLYLVFRNCHFEGFYKKYTRARSKEIIVVSRFVVVVLLLSSYTIFVSLQYFPLDITDFILTVYMINN